MLVFARYFIELPLDARSVERAITQDLASRLLPIARRATSRGDELLAEVGVGERIRVERAVVVTIGVPIETTSKTVIPLSWRAVGTTAGLFPTLEADLEVARLGPASTQLAISARYAPPLGALGRALDRAVLHRVAEASIKRFLDQVGDAVLVSASSAPLVGADEAEHDLGTMPT